MSQLTPQQFAGFSEAVLRHYCVAAGITPSDSDVMEARVTALQIVYGDNPDNIPQEPAR